MEILLVTFVRLLNRPNSYDQFWKWIPMALPGEINITCLGCQLSAGQSGSAGIKCVLKKNKNPSVILHFACSFMHFWAVLHSEEAREAINYIIDLLTKVAVKILRRRILEGCRR
jgi:hypothetical protein